MTTVLVAMAEVSAHRMDEYLQAARLGIDPDGVRVELDLTPGIAVAETILTDIDRNRDGVLSRDEQQAYASVVVHALTLDVDGTSLHAQLDTTSFPDADALRRGEGIIRLQAIAALPPLTAGSHHLRFRNRHHPERSVYLANALVPESDAVAVREQRRDGDQTELTIDYVLRAVPARSAAPWLLGSLAAAMILSAMLVRRSLFVASRP